MGTARWEGRRRHGGGVGDRAGLRHPVRRRGCHGGGRGHRRRRGPARWPKALGGVAVHADVSRPDDWVAVVESVRSLGGVDVVYLNAGVTTLEGDITALTDDQYRRILAVNVDGVVFGARALVPELVARGGGALVATASLAGPGRLRRRPHLRPDQARGGGPRPRPGADTDRPGHHGERRLPRNGRHPARRRRPRRPGGGASSRSSPPRPSSRPCSAAFSVTRTGQAVVVQAGREPTPFRFSRPPGPRQAGAEGQGPAGTAGRTIDP